MRFLSVTTIVFLLSLGHVDAFPKIVKIKSNQDYLLIENKDLPIIDLKITFDSGSIDDEENGQLVAKILEEFPHLKKIDEVSLIPENDRDGVYAALLG